MEWDDFEDASGHSSGVPLLFGGQVIDTPSSGRFVLEEVIGSGTEGVVWKAIRCGGEQTRTSVAIKFYYELKSLHESHYVQAAFRHGNLMHVHDAGRFEKVLFVVSDFVDGRELSELFPVIGRLNRDVQVSVAGYVAYSLLTAVDLIHTMSSNGSPLGMVHGDVSAANVTVSTSGEIVLVDYGLTHRQVSDDGEARATDIRSIGNLLWTMLHIRDSEEGVPMQVRRAWRSAKLDGEVVEWALQDVPQEMRMIVLRLLEAKGAEPFDSAVEARHAMRDAGLNCREDLILAPLVCGALNIASARTALTGPHAMAGFEH